MSAFSHLARAYQLLPTKIKIWHIGATNQRFVILSAPEHNFWISLEKRGIKARMEE
jgi:hypothetical protein